jgi:hypothetical protein
LLAEYDAADAVFDVYQFGGDFFQIADKLGLVR